MRPRGVILMQLFVGYGSDTDCDGTQRYMILFRAENTGDAWNFVEHRGSMTMEGIYSIEPLIDARINLSREQWCAALLWLAADERDGIDSPYGYHTLDAVWNPWVHDDTIGIPALDTRYEED